MSITGRRTGRILVAALLAGALALPTSAAEAAPTPAPPSPSSPERPPSSEVLATDPATAAVPFAAAAVVSSNCPAVGSGINRTAPGAGKTVALTFDDGPGASTAAIMQILRNAGVPATFFNIGVNETVRPSLVQDEANQGFLLGSHTWDHPDMTTLSSTAQASQMDRASSEQISLVGSAPCVFRPPYGAYNSTTLSLAQARNMSVWNWSVDTEDWKAAGSGSAEWVNRILTLNQAGGSQQHPVVLMHNQPGGNPATVAALPGIIQFYRDRGYGFVTLMPSAIQGRYASDPALRSTLGLPLGLEQYGTGFAWQQYERGRLYWSPSTGVHLLRGSILDAFLAAGGVPALGAPTIDEGVAGGGNGAYSDFSRDASIFWSPGTGAHVIRGAIRGRWTALGKEWGLGFPVTDEVSAGGAAVQTFTGGEIDWSSATGAHAVVGAIRQRWTELGAGPALGLPLTEELALGTGGGVYQLFQQCKFFWSPATGAQPVRGAIRATYESLGSEWSRLGLPTSAEYAIPGGWRQEFAHGQLSWDAATGVTTATYF
jgi:peptidoglycan/xylan/chitin deacetylase (PgdA/CDA1 family)